MTPQSANKMKHRLAKIIEPVSKLSLWSGRLAAFLVMPLVVAMVYEVVSRYLFDAPTQWAFEISYMLMGSIFLLGMSYALSIDAHVNVDFMHNVLPPRWIAVIDGIAYFVLTVFFAFLTLSLAQSALRAFESGEGSGLSAWNPQIWPYRVIYVLGMTVMVFQSFAKILQSALLATETQREEK
jgi:TRAP-type mannitol/chloroaromatic compound transport system permease small subunit